MSKIESAGAKIRFLIKLDIYFIKHTHTTHTKHYLVELNKKLV